MAPFDPSPLFKHEKIALQLSGGKDSLAVLYLLRPHLERLTVYYCDSGDTFPETHRVLNEVKKFIPNFVTIQGFQPQVIKTYGWPSDLIGCGNTPMGRILEQQAPLLQDRYTCCYKSIMEPTDARMRDDGITLIIRGQKNEDKQKPILRSGDSLSGFEFLYPIENWTEEDVFAYLRAVDAPIPEYYRYMSSGADCQNCTAWLEHGLLDYLKARQPSQAVALKGRLREIHASVIHHAIKLNEVVNHE